MADFNEAVKKSLIIEAGYWDDPRGGPTKYGITEPTLAEAKRRGIVPADRTTKDLTPGEAAAIYKVLFWDVVKGDFFSSQAVAEELFDTAINCGPGTAVKCAQRALQFLGEMLTADGALGAITYKHIEKWCQKNPEALFRAMNGEQYIYYKSIKGITFPAGWMKRIQDYN